MKKKLRILILTGILAQPIVYQPHINADYDEVISNQHEQKSEISSDKVDEDDFEELFIIQDKKEEMPAWKLYIQSIGIYILGYYLSFKDHFNCYRLKITKAVLDRFKRITR